jgi:hypothetical protein
MEKGGSFSFPIPLGLGLNCELMMRVIGSTTPHFTHTRLNIKYAGAQYEMNVSGFLGSGMDLILTLVLVLWRDLSTGVECGFLFTSDSLWVAWLRVISTLVEASNEGHLCPYCTMFFDLGYLL